MKIVCAFTALEPATRAALDRSGYPVEYHYVGGSDTAYPELIERLWAISPGGFLVWEHDVVIPQETLDAMIVCPEPFCAGVYDWSTNRGPALGATKFGAGLLQACPNAAAEALGGSWRQFDYVLMRTILAGRYQQRPHVHLPEAVHLNPEKSPLLSPYDEWTTEEHLNNLGWWLDSPTTATYRGGVYG